MFFKEDDDFLEPKKNVFKKEEPKVYKRMLMFLTIFFLTISLSYQYFQNLNKKQIIKKLIIENNHHKKKQNNFNKIKVENIKLKREMSKLKENFLKYQKENKTLKKIVKKQKNLIYF